MEQFANQNREVLCMLGQTLCAYTGGYCMPLAHRVIPTFGRNRDTLVFFHQVG